MANNFWATNAVPASNIFAEKPGKINIQFSGNVNWNKVVKVQYTIFEKIFTLSVLKNTLLKKTNNQEGFLEIVFPEALAGATIHLTLFITIDQPDYIMVPLSCQIDVYSSHGLILQEVENVFWTAEQYAAYKICFPIKKEAYTNEYAFLHIHTRGLYGKDVFVELREYDNETDIRPIKSKDENSDKRSSLKKHQVRNNVLSIPYPMKAVLADFDEDYLTITEGDCIELYSRVHFLKESINQGTKSELMYLFLKGKAPNPLTVATTQVKTTIDEDDLLMLVRTDADCSLEFRPHKDYKGEYGFDWIRNMDTLIYASNKFNDNSFQNIMGKYTITEQSTNRKIIQSDINSYVGDFIKDSSPANSLIYNTERGNNLDTGFRNEKMYGLLVREYLQLLFKWQDVYTKKPLRTYTPVMTLLIRDKDGNISPKDAELALMLNVKKIPEKIVLEFNHPKAAQYLTLSQTEYTGLTAGESDISSDPRLNLTITCQAEFKDIYTLFARAFGENDPKGMICGMLQILPNGEGFYQKIKLVVFTVLTQINPGPAKDGVNLKNKSFERMIKLLGQALLVIEYEEEEIDLTSAPNFIANCCMQITNKNYLPQGQSSGYVLDRSKRLTTNGLVNTLEAARSSIYDDYYRLYCVDEYLLEKNSAGRIMGENHGFSNPNINPNPAFIFSGGDDDNAAHEVGHSLGLMHTYDGVSKTAKYTYEALKTNNVMDYYAGTKSSFYYWQWKILNKNIK